MSTPTLYLKALPTEVVAKMFDCSIGLLRGNILYSQAVTGEYNGFVFVRATKSGLIHNPKNPSIYNINELTGRNVVIVDQQTPNFEVDNDVYVSTVINKRPRTTSSVEMDWLTSRFKDYCWRLGFEPEEVKTDDTAFHVRVKNNLFENVKCAFTGNSLDEQGNLWMHLDFQDIHNDCIINHNRLTTEWFRSYKIPNLSK